MKQLEDLTKTRIPKQYRGKSKFKDWALIVPRVGQEIADSLERIHDNYDIDKAKGEELDIIGRIVGASREQADSVIPIEPIITSINFTPSDAEYINGFQVSAAIDNPQGQAVSYHWYGELVPDSQKNKPILNIGPVPLKTYKFVLVISNYDFGDSAPFTATFTPEPQTFVVTPEYYEVGGSYGFTIANSSRTMGGTKVRMGDKTTRMGAFQDPHASDIVPYYADVIFSGELIRFNFVSMLALHDGDVVISFDTINETRSSPFSFERNFKLDIDGTVALMTPISSSSIKISPNDAAIAGVEIYEKLKAAEESSSTVNMGLWEVPPASSFLLPLLSDGDDHSQEISDMYFRIILKAKIIKNTSNATYTDIISAVMQIVKNASNVSILDRHDRTYKINIEGRVAAAERNVLKLDILPRPHGTRQDEFIFKGDHVKIRMGAGNKMGDPLTRMGGTNIVEN